MSNQVLVVSQETILKMKEQYRPGLVSKVPSGAIFSAKLGGTTITAYKSGKVLFQGSNSSEEAAKWGSIGSSSLASTAKANPFKKPSIPHSYGPPPQLDKLCMIGSDEAGTGDFFGPITVSAAYVNVDMVEQLERMGIRDSKTIKDPHILQMGPRLTNLIPYSLLVLPNEKYNILQAKGMTQGKMKAMLHEQAIAHLLEKLGPITPDGILIDQFCEPAVYFKHTKTTGKRAVPLYFSTKAESISTAVAAGSVIARYAFLKHMDLLSEKAGLTIPKGAGSTVDQIAAQLLLTRGEEFLGSITKSHFANTDKARNIAQKSDY